MKNRSFWGLQELVTSKSEWQRNGWLGDLTRDDTVVWRRFYHFLYGSIFCANHHNNIKTSVVVFIRFWSTETCSALWRKGSNRYFMHQHNNFNKFISRLKVKKQIDSSIKNMCSFASQQSVFTCSLYFKTGPTEIKISPLYVYFQTEKHQWLPEIHHVWWNQIHKEFSAKKMDSTIHIFTITFLKRPKS